MFKTTVVLGAATFLLLHLTTACNYVATQPLDDLSNSARLTIANELVAASSAYWSDKNRPVYVRVEPAHHWLQNELRDAFAANQYRLTNGPIVNHNLVAVATELGSDALRVSLTIDDQHQVERLFRFEHTDQNEVSDSFAESDYKRLEATHFPIERRGWVEREASLPTEQPNEASPSRQVSPSAFNTSTHDEASDSGACTEAVIRKGSLKQNLVHIFQTCGWRLVDWPADPNRPNHELDWLVPSTQTLAFKSLGELFDALHIAFDLEIELNHSTRTVRIQSRD